MQITSWCKMKGKKGTVIHIGAKALLKFMFSKKAIKIDEIFTVDLTLCSKYQIFSEDFVKSRGLLRKHELKNSWNAKIMRFDKENTHKLQSQAYQKQKIE